VTEPGPIAGRKVGVIVGDKPDLAGIAQLRAVLEREGALLHVIAETGGVIKRGGREEVVERTFLTTRSIEFDAIVAARGSSSADDVKVRVLLEEAYRHCKAIAAWGDGVELLESAGIGLDAPGVLHAEKASASLRKDLVAAIGLHRAWDRAPIIMAS